MFGGLERDSSDVWSFVRFHVSLWVLVLKVICNYPDCTIGVHFFIGGFLLRKTSNIAVEEKMSFNSSCI